MTAKRQTRSIRPLMLAGCCCLALFAGNMAMAQQPGFSMRGTAMPGFGQTAALPADLEASISFASRVSEAALVRAVQQAALVYPDLSDAILDRAFDAIFAVAIWPPRPSGPPSCLMAGPCGLIFWMRFITPHVRA